ncbi:MAG: histidinol-phosphate transaminase [Pyrinomonadaceae bacterium]
MSIDPESLARKNIRRLKPYSSARGEFSGTADVYLDANENAFGSPIEQQLNRYPDPLQMKLKEKIAESKGVTVEQIFIGNGSDEAIDLLFRIFCEPGTDACVICPPTYGMYKVAADINDVVVTEVPLNSDFQLDVPEIRKAEGRSMKLIFVCSPNNPTGNSINRVDILRLAKTFDGIVVVDEAYIHFSRESSLIDEIDDHPNFVVLQTFSKAWGLAAARVGMAFADERIIKLFNRVKPPYNISALAQNAALDALGNDVQVDEWVRMISEERVVLTDSLKRLDVVERVYPSDANFVLVKVADASAAYKFLLEQRIVVRDRSNVTMCEGCLRITVGTSEENARVVEALKKFEQNTFAAS